MTPSLQGRIDDALCRNGWFRRRPAELRGRMVKYAQVGTVEAGRWLYDQGDEAHGLYGVLSGSVTTYVTLENGQNVPINISGPGAIFGYAAQVLGGRRVTSAVARERSEIIFIPQRALASIAHDLPSLWLHFAELATEQLSWAAKIIAERTSLPPAACLASRLHAYGIAWGATDGSIALPIRQDELADMTGFSRKTINKILRDFETQGLVALGYREITIRDLPGLMREALRDGRQ
jgi:CRP-like cAMP-binding protein